MPIGGWLFRYMWAGNVLGWIWLFLKPVEPGISLLFIRLDSPNLKKEIYMGSCTKI